MGFFGGLAGLRLTNALAQEQHELMARTQEPFVIIGKEMKPRNTTILGTDPFMMGMEM
jgi:hypothetical protein